VLVARRPPAAAAFPERILVATDGSPDAERAVELTARIGKRHRSRVYLLNVDPSPHGDRGRIAVDAVDITAALGSDPVMLSAAGHADERILELTASESVSLVAVGSRGLTGLRALGSVSERVAHRAPCSVLVARHA
jgi:nucleotide-binding universal stress UspA family protein